MTPDNLESRRELRFAIAFLVAWILLGLFAIFAAFALATGPFIVLELVCAAYAAYSAARFVRSIRRYVKRGRR